ncbi:MAG: OadG family protein [Lachnospiraceae bacterium]|nr:OadG family protein [Lachnospiraceae bacterium]
MKKWLSVIGIITCVFALTACGSTTPKRVSGTALDSTSEQQWISQGEQIVSSLQQIVASGSEESVAKDPVVKAAVDGYKNSAEDIGAVSGFIDEYAVASGDKQITVSIGVDGDVHDADVVMVIDEESSGYKLSSVATNVRYSMPELMEQAGLNTVLGMGTTFVVLILLAFLISLFRFIPKIQAAMSKKEETPVPAPAAAPAPAEDAAEETEDDALIAVIAAAVAASEGAQTTDGFVVRSIRKSRSRF